MCVSFFSSFDFLKEFRSLHTLEHPVELGSSVDSDNGGCIEHYIHHQRHNEGTSLANCGDVTSFDEDNRSVDSAVDALTGMEVGGDGASGGSTSSLGNHGSPGSDYVVVTDKEVKEANTTPSPCFGSPQRRRKCLRKGETLNPYPIICVELC